MKGVCSEVCKDFNSGSPKISAELNRVAQAFIELQQNRHDADYDNARNWSRFDVEQMLDIATKAFDAWKAIRSTDAAQDYLLSLFLPKLPRT
jgi:hypothetical protein